MEARKKSSLVKIKLNLRELAQWELMRKLLRITEVNKLADSLTEELIETEVKVIETGLGGKCAWRI
jgi:hypothetical protein